MMPAIMPPYHPFHQPISHMRSQMVHPTQPKVEQKPRHQNHSLPQPHGPP
jgi:hypothetical protein